MSKERFSSPDSVYKRRRLQKEMTGKGTPEQSYLLAHMSKHGKSEKSEVTIPPTDADIDLPDSGLSGLKEENSFASSRSEPIPIVKNGGHGHPPKANSWQQQVQLDSVCDVGTGSL